MEIFGTASISPVALANSRLILNMRQVYYETQRTSQRSIWEVFYTPTEARSSPEEVGIRLDSIRGDGPLEEEEE